MTPLDERKRSILKAVVDDYIETAEPIGSKQLVSRHALSVSPATVRNEMSDLEHLGYLEQPHTSAGRIPSDKGYREYVDSLMRVEVLPSEEQDSIRSRLADHFDELSEVLRNASSVLSSSTGYTSVAMTPRLRQSHLKQIKMLMIEPGRAVVVVVLAAGIVKDRVVRIPELMDAETLAKVSAAVEAGLSGMKLEDITLIAVTAAGRRAKLPDSLLNQILYEAYISIKQADSMSVYMEGSHRMLGFPEFQEIRKARGFLDALAEEGLIAGYLAEEAPGTSEDADAEKSPYMIRIGQEIALEGLDGCSFVTTTCRDGATLLGSIGVIGPKRMDYSNVVSHIGFVRRTIDDGIRQLMEGHRPTEDRAR
jgi:heat-inducible transcriptional repressor